MKKIKLYSGPILLLLAFVLIMNSGEFLKKPLGNADNVQLYADFLKEDIIKGNWEKGKSDLEKLKTAWRIVKGRIQFSVERDEMDTIDSSIARIRGEIFIHDRSSAFTDLAELIEHWEQLDK